MFFLDSSSGRHNISKVDPDIKENGKENLVR
jgi:hypothetical protein